MIFHSGKRGVQETEVPGENLRQMALRTDVTYRDCPDTRSESSASEVAIKRVC